MTMFATRTATLGELVQAVAIAAAAETAYYAFPQPADDLRDIDLFNARINAERDLAAALVAYGVTPAHARTMAEALS